MWAGADRVRAMGPPPVSTCMRVIQAAVFFDFFDLFFGIKRPHFHAAHMGISTFQRPSFISCGDLQYSFVANSQLFSCKMIRRGST